MWTIIIRDSQGKELGRGDLEPGATLTIGREKDRGLVLPSGAVSRRHARFESQGQSLLFIDEGSANGSLVNGQKAAKPVSVDESTVIEITPFRLQVLRVEDEDEERTVMLRRPQAAPSPPPPKPAAAPPPRPAPPPPRQPQAPSSGSGVEGFDGKFILPGESPGPGASAGGGPTEDAAAAELDRQIAGIRQHRESAESTTQTKMIQIDQDWRKVIAAMQAVKKKLAGNPKLMAFDISRDQTEIQVKIKDARQRVGYRYFLLSRQHPEGKYESLDAVWLRELGREDQDFRDPKAAQSEILQRIAATLA